MTFQRQNKYAVIKWDDFKKALDLGYILPETGNQFFGVLEGIRQYRRDAGKQNHSFVCVKDTYPEYEYVWKCIEERVTKKEQEQNDN